MGLDVALMQGLGGGGKVAPSHSHWPALVASSRAAHIMQTRRDCGSDQPLITIGKAHSELGQQC